MIRLAAWLLVGILGSPEIVTASTGGGARNSVQRIEVSSDATSVLVTIVMRSPPTFTTRVVGARRTFVIDLPEARFEHFTAVTPVANGVLDRVESSIVSREGIPAARVALVLSQDGEPPLIDADGALLRIRIPGVTRARLLAKEAAPASPPEPVAAKPEPPAPAPPAPVAAIPEPPAPPPAPAPPAAVAAIPEPPAPAPPAAVAAIPEPPAPSPPAPVAATPEPVAPVSPAPAPRAPVAAIPEPPAPAPPAPVAAIPEPPAPAPPAPVAAIPEPPAPAPPAPVAAIAEPPAPPPAPAPPAAVAAIPEPAAPAPQPPVAVAPPPPPQRERVSVGKARPVAEPRRKLREVTFRPLAQSSAIVLRLSAPPSFEVVDVDERRVWIGLSNTTLERKNDARPLDTSFFPGAVSSIVSRAAGGGIRVEIVLKQRAAHRERVEGDALVIEFEHPADP